jgi:hypothetical protein
MACRHVDAEKVKRSSRKYIVSRFEAESGSEFGGNRVEADTTTETGRANLWNIL